MFNDKKILKCSHGENSLRAPFLIYAGLKSLQEKMHSCQNNIEKSYIEKKKLSIHQLVTYYLQIVHLTKQKTNLIITKVKTV